MSLQTPSAALTLSAATNMRSSMWLFYLVSTCLVAISTCQDDNPGPAALSEDVEAWHLKPHYFILSVGGTGYEYCCELTLTMSLPQSGTRTDHLQRCTSLFHLLKYRHIPTNHKGDKDGLKHPPFPILSERLGQGEWCCPSSSQQVACDDHVPSLMCAPQCQKSHLRKFPICESTSDNLFVANHLSENRDRVAIAGGIYVFEDPIRRYIVTEEID